MCIRDSFGMILEGPTRTGFLKKYLLLRPLELKTHCWVMSVYTEILQLLQYSKNGCNTSCSFGMACWCNLVETQYAVSSAYWATPGAGYLKCCGGGGSFVKMIGSIEEANG